MGQSVTISVSVMIQVLFRDINKVLNEVDLFVN